MRILLLTAMLLLGACNVQTDSANNEVTVQYNAEVAQNAAEDVGNTAEDIGEAIANEADETADKINNSGIVTNDNERADENRQ